MYRNSEKYADPMAGTALAHIMYEEKLARRKARQMERKDGKCVISESSVNLRHCGKQQRVCGAGCCGAFVGYDRRYDNDGAERR